MKFRLIVPCCCLMISQLLVADGIANQQQTGERAASVASGQVEIKIGNFKFLPEVITVAAGTRLVWINQDDVPHTVIGTQAGSPIKSPALDTDDNYTVVLTKPGAYNYFCSLHPHMTGTVIVR